MELHRSLPVFLISGIRRVQRILSLAKFINSLLNLYNFIDTLWNRAILIITNRGESPLSKSVYSLVLMDEVVEAVDRLAYERHTSRSGLINRILADYLSCPTPESRIRDIFGCMEQMFSNLDNFQFREQPSESMVTIRSAMHYRYRPTARYLLELYRDPGPYLGELRVSFRTQSDGLLEISEGFFRFWKQLEGKAVSGYFPNRKIPCSAEPGRYTRRLLRPKSDGSMASETLAEAILGYIRLFDASMKEYFGTDNPADTRRKIEENYIDRLNRSHIL